MRAAVLALMGFWTAPTGAQVIFLDEFQGPALAAHWIAPPPSHWDYSFNNGMLNVTGLHHPSMPHSSTNWASIAAHFAPQTDFRADIWMGWVAGQPWHSMAVFFLGPQFQILADFTYTDEPIFGPGPVVFAVASNQSVVAAAPHAGTHRFTISRTDAQFTFRVNGAHCAVFTDNFGIPVSAIGLQFMRSYPGDFAPLHVDRIVIVPAPATGALVCLVVLYVTRPRRQRAAS
jgi:hypothetical protein